MAGYKVWRLHRRMRQFMQDPFGQQQQQRRQSSNPFSDFFGSRKTKQRRNRRKKIPRGVGEYVEFTEVAGTVGDDTSANGSKSVKFKKEEQIQDIEWEDI
jgi:hypothetical protein